MTSYLRAITFALALTLLGCGSGDEPDSRGANPETAPSVTDTDSSHGETVTVVFDFGGERESRTIEVVHLPGTPLFDLMRFARFDGDLAFEEDGDEMPFVTSIEGVANEGAGGRNWQFWIDGEYSTVGAGGYEPRPGARVEWRFTENAMGGDDE